MRKLLSFIFCCGIAMNLFAQNANPKYTATDATVEKLGPLTSLNVATITDTITRPFADKEMMARAIYYWITHHIAIDPKLTKNNDKKNSLPEQVIQLRKATGTGFSLLLQEMCSLVKIRCLSIDGYLKTFSDQINEPADEVNHSWNVIQLGQSPESWYYVDAAQGSGFLDRKMSVFTRNFTTNYFFANRTLFNLDHYPDNTAWQLGPGPKSIKSFYSLPVISSAAYELGMGKPSPETGIIKTKNTTAVNFSFPYNGEKIAFIKLKIGENKKQIITEPMNFTTDGNVIRFAYTFKVADEYPVSIMVDDRELVAYQVISEEK